MKLHRQAPAKAAIAALTAGLLFGFFALVRSQPRTKAQAATSTPPAGVDYQRFFAPGSTGQSLPQELKATHSRTRAS